jgi:hypothetical protein
MKVTYTVKQDIRYGNERWIVSEYLDGVWNNSREFSREKTAIERCDYLNEFVVRNNIESSLFDARR